MNKDALSPRLKAKFPAYVPRIKQPGEAAARIVNTCAKGKNKYKPELHACARAGLAMYS